MIDNSVMQQNTSSICSVAAIIVYAVEIH